MSTNPNPARRPVPPSHARIGRHRSELRGHRRRRVAAAALAPLAAVGGGALLLPSASAAVGEGRSLEADYGIEMVILGGYAPRTPVTVEVLRDGAVVGAVTTPTLADGSLEIHHGGGGQFPTGDCWGRPYTPDIQPGDTVRATQGGIVDFTVVRDVFIDTENVRYDAAAGTITVRGHARGTTGAPIDVGGDALSILVRFPIDVNPVPPEGPTQSLSRSDRVGDEINEELDANGGFTHTFRGYSRADIEAIRDTPGTEVIAEWGGGAVGEADPNELSVYSGDAGPLGGCPPYAPADQVPPSQVTGVVASQPGAGVVELDWTAATDNTGVTGYVVTRTNLDTGAVNTYQAGADLFWSQTRVATGRYSYEVHAVDATGNAGAKSAAVLVGVGVEAPPAAPTGLTAAVTGNAVALSWNAPTAGTPAVSYQVLRGSTPIANPSGTSYTDPNRPAGTYSYTVRSRAADGSLSPASEPATATVVAANEAPRVTGRTPAIGAFSVGVGGNVTATFSEAVLGVGTGTFQVRNPAGTVIGSAVSQSPTNARQWILNPTANLAPDTRYTVTLTGGTSAIRDNQGAVLVGTTAQPLSWSFTTGPAPRVTNRTPAVGATGVGRGNNITATFSEAVRNVSGTTFYLRTATGTTNIAATVTRDGTTNRWILNPSANLAANRQYRVTLDGGAGTGTIRDGAGNVLAGDVTWTFTTGA